MVTGKTPRLTIGLPVYNGERFVRFAIDSILSQTYRDFELIISDNASTDSTMQICQEYAARDSRIRYVRNQNNIGAAANFNHVFSMARGELFKWAAADDVISPDFLEKCIEVLDRDPEVVLSYSKVDRINSSGEIDGSYDYPMRVTDPRPYVRFADLILVNHFCVAVFGVTYRDVLAQTPLIGKYVGSDRVLLAELGLRGKMYEISEYLFHRREHPQTSGRMFRIHDRLAWFDPSKRGQLNLVYWKIGAEYANSINRVPLDRAEKMRCYRTLARWYGRRRSFLIQDVKAGIYQLFPFTRNVVQYARKRQNKHMNSGGGI